VQQETHGTISFADAADAGDLKLKSPFSASIGILVLRHSGILRQGTQGQDLVECFPVALLVAAAHPIVICGHCLTGLVLEGQPTVGRVVPHASHSDIKQRAAPQGHRHEASFTLELKLKI